MQMHSFVSRCAHEVQQHGNPVVTRLLAAVVCLSAAVGCGTEAGPSGAEELGTQHEAMETGNEVLPRELSVNGLSVNGLSVNGLSVNGLSVNGLSVNGL